MTAMELIGQVAEHYVWSILPDDSVQYSTARFLLGRLTGGPKHPDGGFL